jgi:hypothetical protein
VPLLGPLSAVGNIFKRCLNLSFGGASAINVADVTASGAGVSFITQGSPFPIRQLSFVSEQLTPRKIALGTVATRELVEGSDAEAVLSRVLVADLSLGLESVLFDATASDATRPAGLKYGIAALTADTGTDVTAMFNDLAALAASVAVVGGMNFGYIASPKQAAKIALRKSANNFPYPIYASSALPDKQVCALAFNALAIAGDALPRIETSKTSTLHMDSSPAPLSATGTPNTISAPISSLYRQDLIGLRLIADISWVLRSASGCLDQQRCLVITMNKAEREALIAELKAQNDAGEAEIEQRRADRLARQLAGIEPVDDYVMPESLVTKSNHDDGFDLQNALDDQAWCCDFQAWGTLRSRHLWDQDLSIAGSWSVPCPGCWKPPTAKRL